MDEVDGRTGSDVRLTLIGPMPPPTGGQALVMGQMVAELAAHFPQMRIEDIGGGLGAGWLRRFKRLLQSAAALWAIPGSQTVYVAVKAGHGMWLTTAAAALARLTGARLFLHHHSYLYVDERKTRMVALTRVAGSRTHHIVLSRSMASSLCHVMPEIRRPMIIIGNAGFIDKTLLELPLKADGGDLVLGHLSLLHREKGIAEVVDLALALHQAGIRARLVVGGPTMDDESRLQLDRASRELGELFEYRGIVEGEAKRVFFEEITHFLLPSRMDAVPLVLYEAMAAGVICVSTRQGSIAEQLEGTPGLLADSADSFVEETLPELARASVSTAASQQSRQGYLRALSESERQLAGFVALLARP